MSETDNRSRLPAVVPTQLISRGIVWIKDRRGYIKPRKPSGNWALLMVPMFMLGFVFLLLVLGLLLLFFALYVIYYSLVSLPRSIKRNILSHR